MAKNTTPTPPAPTSKEDAAQLAKLEQAAALAEKTALDSKSAPVAQAPLAVDHEKMNDGVKALARRFYTSYTNNSGGLAWDGRPCPKWEDLNNAVRSHWCAVAIESMAVVRSQAEGELTQLRDQAASMQGQIDAARRDLDDARAFLEAKKAADAGNADASTLVDQLRGELAQCRNDLKRRTADLDDARRTLSRVEAGLKSNAKILAAERTSMLEGEVEKLRQQIAGLEADLRAAKSTVSELEAKLKHRTVGPS